MKRKQSENFEEKLAIGAIGEDIVFNYLVARNSFVHDHRKEKCKDSGGPRLIGTEGHLILPDFSVRNKNLNKGDFAVESKVKTSIYPINRKMCFTVDNKYEHYLRSVKILKLNFLVMAFLFEDRIYFYKDTECDGITTYNNKYGNGKVYLFEYNRKNIVY